MPNLNSTISSCAPGRVELLGNHTDYNGGVVLAAAIDRGVTVSGEMRKDGMAELHSEALGRGVRVALSELVPQREEAWANYSLGVVRELIAAGLPVNGFSATIASDLPLGAGLSSSAALEVATAFFLLKLHGVSEAPMHVAKLCQRAENRFVGVPCGLLDQATSVFGRRQHAVFLDCRTDEVRRVVFPADLALVIANSVTQHALADGAYRQRREECESAARSLNVVALRDVTSAQLNAADIDPLLRRRAAHIVGENERVWRALDLLERGDGAGFGRLMYESHESSRSNFENSTPELDHLVELARELPGVLGSRLTGGGFGGATVTLAPVDRAEAVAAELGERYFARTGVRSAPFVLPPLRRRTMRKGVSFATRLRLPQCRFPFGPAAPS